MFAAFGLFGLFMISSKYERRQAKIEQQFHGIQQMQKDAGGGEAGQVAPPRTPDQRPLIITLRPLMIVLGMVTVVASIVVAFLTRRPSDSSD